jgi:predicted DNA-binding transcriptional regulator AlpA
MEKEIFSNLSFPDPELVEFERIPAVMAHLSVLAGRLSAIQTRLSTRLLIENPRPADSAEEDVVIDVKEAAALLAVQPSWLYRHAKTLPFTRRLSRGNLRFNKRGLIAWRERRRS